MIHPPATPISALQSWGFTDPWMWFNSCFSASGFNIISSPHCFSENSPSCLRVLVLLTPGSTLTQFSPFFTIRKSCKYFLHIPKLNLSSFLFQLFFRLLFTFCGRFPNFRNFGIGAVIPGDGWSFCFYFLASECHDEEQRWQLAVLPSSCSASSALASLTSVPRVSPLLNWTKKSLVFIIYIAGLFLSPALGENLDSRKLRSTIVLNNIGWRYSPALHNCGL